MSSELCGVKQGVGKAGDPRPHLDDGIEANGARRGWRRAPRPRPEPRLLALKGTGVGGATLQEGDVHGILTNWSWIQKSLRRAGLQNLYLNAVNHLEELIINPGAIKVFIPDVGLNQWQISREK